LKGARFDIEKAKEERARSLTKLGEIKRSFPSEGYSRFYREPLLVVLNSE
jgi:hypothetical protein